MTDPTNPTVEKVLVLGGAGYIGSVLTRLLLDEGYQATVFDNLLFGQESLTELSGRDGFRLIEGDLRDVAAVSGAVRGMDAVILLAALVGEPACDRDPKATVDINYLGSRNAIEACRYYKVPRFLFASTDSCYGIQEGILYEDSDLRPISLYGELKRDIERELLILKGVEGFCPTILRLATVYGLSPRMRFDLIINILTMHGVVNNKIKIFGGKQWRPLVHVRDVARGFLACLKAPEDRIRGEVFNIGSNDQNYQIGYLGELVKKSLPEIEIETIDQPPDLRDYHVNFDKAEKVLGYKAEIEVHEAIKEIEKALRTETIKNPTAPKYRNA